MSRCVIVNWIREPSASLRFAYSSRPCKCLAGECPKCGKVLSSGHRKHWDSCSGTGEHKLRRERDADAEDDDEVDELTAQEIEDEVRPVGTAMIATLHNEVAHQYCHVLSSRRGIVRGGRRASCRRWS